METANFGTVLREARERRQVSLAQVASQTKVSVSSLQLLEAGKLADLPHETFVRGFIRSYARSVGVSHVEGEVHSQVREIVELHEAFGARELVGDVFHQDLHAARPRKISVRW